MKNKFTRRKFLPFLSTGMLLPLFGSAKTKKVAHEDTEDGYETMLTPDGKTVRVKSSTLKKSKVVEQQLSNPSMLKWLNKKSNKI